MLQVDVRHRDAPICARLWLLPTESLVAVLVIMLLAVAGKAQDGDQEPLVAVPGVISVPTTNPWSLGQTLLKHASFDSTTPGPAASGAPGTPDFSEPVLFAGISGLDIDAMSTGLDWILADDTGRVPLPGTSSWMWAGIILSPGHTPNLGFSEHSRIANERLRVDGAGADLFFYVLADSRLPGTTVPLPGAEVRLVADSIEISLYNGSPSDSTALDAYDLWAVFYLNPGLQPFLPQPPRLYFSLTTASVGAIPTQWNIPDALKSGATIFLTTWTGSAWTVPTVFRTPGQLGLAATNDVDALAVDADPGRVFGRGGQIYLSFSIVPGEGLNSAPGPGTGLSFARTGANGRTVRTDHHGVPIDSHIGHGVNIRSVCEIDPSRDARFSRLAGFGKAPPVLPWRTGITLSMVWRDYVNQCDMLRTHALGANCTFGQSTSYAACVLVVPNPFVSVGPFFLNPTQRCGGHGSAIWRGGPASLDIPLPPGIDGINLDFCVYWADIHATSQVLTTPLPKGMHF